MHYCGVAVGPEVLYLCALEEVRTDEPPIRLRAAFYEPGGVEDVLGQLATLGDVVVAVGAPQGPSPEGGLRVCDAALRERGVAPLPPTDVGLGLFDGLATLGVFQPADGGGTEGDVPDGAFREAPVFEVNPDAVFCALQGRRVPARRHPLGVRRRIEELTEDHVEDEGGDLWARRIEEVDAAAAALAAHRYAVAHAAWLGDPDEGVVVLPGARPPTAFPTEGVLPEVPRRPLRPGPVS